MTRVSLLSKSWLVLLVVVVVLIALVGCASPPADLPSAKKVGDWWIAVVVASEDRSQTAKTGYYIQNVSLVFEAASDKLQRDGPDGFLIRGGSWEYGCGATDQMPYAAPIVPRCFRRTVTYACSVAEVAPNPRFVAVKSGLLGSRETRFDLVPTSGISAKPYNPVCQIPKAPAPVTYASVPVTIDGAERFVYAEDSRRPGTEVAGIVINATITNNSGQDANFYIQGLQLLTSHGAAYYEDHIYEGGGAPPGRTSRIGIPIDNLKIPLDTDLQGAMLAFVTYKKTGWFIWEKEIPDRVSVVALDTVPQIHLQSRSDYPLSKYYSDMYGWCKLPENQ